MWVGGVGKEERRSGTGVFEGRDVGEERLLEDIRALALALSVPLRGAGSSTVERMRRKGRTGSTIRFDDRLGEVKLVKNSVWTTARDCLQAPSTRRRQMQVRHTQRSANLRSFSPPASHLNSSLAVLAAPAHASRRSRDIKGGRATPSSLTATCSVVRLQPCPASANRCGSPRDCSRGSLCPFVSLFIFNRVMAHPHPHSSFLFMFLTTPPSITAITFPSMRPSHPSTSLSHLLTHLTACRPPHLYPSSLLSRALPILALHSTRRNVLPTPDHEFFIILETARIPSTTPPFHHQFLFSEPVTNQLHTLLT